MRNEAEQVLPVFAGLARADCAVAAAYCSASGGTEAEQKRNTGGTRDSETE